MPSTVRAKFLKTIIDSYTLEHGMIWLKNCDHKGFPIFVFIFKKDLKKYKIKIYPEDYVKFHHDHELERCSLLIKENFSKCKWILGIPLFNRHCVEYSVDEKAVTFRAIKDSHQKP